MLGSTYSSSSGAISSGFQWESVAWGRLVRGRSVGWTVAPFVVAGFGAMPDTHSPLLHCACYAPQLTPRLVSVTHLVGDPDLPAERSDSLVTGALLGQSYCNCPITIKNGQDITKRYPGTSLKYQI